MNNILQNWSNWSPHLVPQAGRTGAGHLAGGFVGQAFPLLLTHKIRTHLLYLHSQIFSSSLCRSETNLENQLAPVEHQENTIYMYVVVVLAKLMLS